VSVSKACPRGAPSKSISGSSGRWHVTVSPTSSHRVYVSFSVFSPLLALYWFSAPALAFLRPSRCSQRRLASRFNSCGLSLLLFVRVQSVSRAFLSRSLTSSLCRSFLLSSSLEMAPSRPSHEVSHLTATSDAGSDLHRGYLPQLCCVLRFSQPLDALFRPHPLGPISCRSRSGFHLQSLSPHDSLVCLSAPSAPLAVR
jgi:hypothetical protein